jgi:hypothetical protein
VSKALSIRRNVHPILRGGHRGDHASWGRGYAPSAAHLVRPRVAQASEVAQIPIDSAPPVTCQPRTGVPLGTSSGSHRPHITPTLSWGRGGSQTTAAFTAAAASASHNPTLSWGRGGAPTILGSRRLRNLCDSFAIATGRHHPTAQVWGRSLGRNPTAPRTVPRPPAGSIPTTHYVPEATSPGTPNHEFVEKLCSYLQRWMGSCHRSCGAGLPAVSHRFVGEMGVVSSRGRPLRNAQNSGFHEPHVSMGFPRDCAVPWSDRMPTHLQRSPRFYGNPTKQWGRQRRFRTSPAFLGPTCGYLVPWASRGF